VRARDGVAVHCRVVGRRHVERRPHIFGDDATERTAQREELGRSATVDLGQDPILAVLHREHGDIIRGMVEDRPAGFWIRAVALALDFAIFSLVQASYGALAHLVWGTQVQDAWTLAPTLWTFTFVFAAVYTTVLHALFGQTIGKMIVGVHVVVGEDGAQPARGADPRRVPRRRGASRARGPGQRRRQCARRGLARRRRAAARRGAPRESPARERGTRHSVAGEPGAVARRGPRRGSDTP